MAPFVMAQWHGLLSAMSRSRNLSTVITSLIAGNSFCVTISWITTARLGSERDRALFDQNGSNSEKPKRIVQLERSSYSSWRALAMVSSLKHLRISRTAKASASGLRIPNPAEIPRGPPARYRKARRPGYSTSPYRRDHGAIRIRVQRGSALPGFFEPCACHYRCIHRSTSLWRGQDGYGTQKLDSPAQNVKLKVAHTNAPLQPVLVSDPDNPKVRHRGKVDQPLYREVHRAKKEG